MTEERRYPPDSWTESLRDICRDVCAYYGEPPCWAVDNTDGDKPPEKVGPCWSCMQEWMEGYQTDD